MQKEVQETLTVLKEGGVVLYPTDTVWGIGCDATNAEAVGKIIKLKGRPEDKSMIVLLDSDAKLNRYVKKVPDIAWELLDAATEPLTIVFQNAIDLPENVTAADGSIAIRIIKEGFAHELIKQLNKPLIATSANASGEPPAIHSSDVSRDLIDKLDHVVISNEEGTGKPSVIMRLSENGEFEFIRK